jgi:acyl carrier protein
MNQDISSRAAKILSLALRKPVEPTHLLSRENTAEWDSLKHVELILMLEEEFHIRFSSAEASSLSSLENIVRQVKEKHGT